MVKALCVGAAMRVAVGTCGAVLGTVSAEPADADRVAAEASTLVRAYHDVGLFSGAVLIGSGDEVVYAEGVGPANLETGQPNTVDTVFKTGSIGKQFFAAVTLRLAERGEIDPHAPIATYLPEYPRPQGDRITPHMLMNQTSGIPNYTRLPMFFESMHEPVDPAAFAAGFTGLELEFEPGTSWAYSNSGYYVLGLIVERVSGKPLAELLDDELFGPLGLTQTGYDGDPSTPAGRALGYEWTPAGMSLEPPVHESKIRSAGMTYSTATELFRWTRLLHAGAPFEQPDTHLQMTDPGEGKTENYVYGIGIREHERGGVVYRGAGHGGGLNGFQTLLVYLTPGDWTLVVLCNSGHDVDDLVSGLQDVIAGVAPEMPRKPLMVALAESIEHGGIDEAQLWIDLVTEEGLHKYLVQEAPLNALGYHYLFQEQLDESIFVLRLNARLFPESSNVYDSLGEAYLARGDTAFALENYKKAAAMDPDNAHAREVVERLESAAP